MSFEDDFLSKGGYGELEKIVKFYKSLIIKNDVEAREYEEPYMTDEFYKYENAYKDTGTTGSVLAYTYTFTDLIEFGFSNEEIISLDLINSISMVKHVDSGVAKCISFIEYMKSNYLSNYDEQNTYYRQFLGLPIDDNDIVEVENLDYLGDDPDSKDFIPIHEVTYSSNRLTYEYYFVKNNIYSLIAEYPDKTYLKFLRTSLTPYYVRNSPNFTIMYYDSDILDDYELERFMTAYNNARIYAFDILMVQGYDSEYPYYSSLILLLVLFMTFNQFYNLKLKDYSLGKYTLEDLYDILDSNGLSGLRKLNNQDILEKIVFNLDTLNAYKGSEYVLDFIFQLVSEDNMLIKKYKLVKNYRTDNSGNLEFDTTKTYEENVGLKFIEETFSASTGTRYDEIEVDYHTMTDNDDLWGGVTSDMNSDDKKALKEQLKKDIIKMDFQTVHTKYISISKSLNIYELSNKTNDIFALILKYFSEVYGNSISNPIYSSKVMYKGMEVEPIFLFCASQYFNNYAYGVSNPENIVVDKLLYSSIMSMRDTSGVGTLVDELGEVKIDVEGSVYNKTIKEILSDEGEYLDELLVSFDLDTTLSTLFEQYEKNYLILDKIRTKLSQSKDTGVYNMWKYLYDQNVKEFDFSFLFGDQTNYLNYIRDKNIVFYNYVFDRIIEMDAMTNDQAIIYSGTLVKELIVAFKGYLEETIDNKYALVDASAGDEDSDTYLKDLRTLLSEFVSVFSELYNVEYITDISDIPYNTFHLTYYCLKDILRLSMNDIVELEETQQLHRIKTVTHDDVYFEEKIRQIINNKINDKFELMDKIERDVSISSLFDNVDMIDTVKNIVVSKNSHSFGLNHILEVIVKYHDIYVSSMLSMIDKIQQIIKNKHDVNVTLSHEIKILNGDKK